MTTGEIWTAGLGAAVLSGVTAAFAAWWVVRLTDRAQVAQARRVRAEDALIDYVRASSTFPVFEEGEGRQLRTVTSVANELVRSQLAAVAGLQHVDPEMADSIVGRTTTLLEALTKLDNVKSDSKARLGAANLLNLVASEASYDVEAWLRFRVVRTPYTVKYPRGFGQATATERDPPAAVVPPEYRE